MSKKQGYISLYRSIQEHWLWKDKPFSRGQAFIDLVLSANHADDKVAVGNEIIEVKRGSFITSQKKLAERWGWSRKKVKVFLELLTLDNMLDVNTDNKRTYLTISNYAVYQGSGDNKRTSNAHQKNIKGTSNAHQTHTNNNDKIMINNANNENNIPPLPPSQSPAKIKYAEFVAMTNDEHQSLLAKYGEEDTGRLIEFLDNYKGSTGKRYKSDYRAILSWCVKRLDEEKSRQPQSAGNPFLDLIKSGRLDDVEGDDVF